MRASCSSEPAAIVPEATVTDVLCNGDENGGFVISATGGSGMGYTYDVDNGGFGPNGEYTGLAAGTYVVTVQDDAECSGSADIVVGSPDAIEVTVDANGGATGSEVRRRSGHHRDGRNGPLHLQLGRPGLHE